MIVKNTTKFVREEIKQSILEENNWTFMKRLIVALLFFVLGLLMTIFNLNSSQDSLPLIIGIGCIAYAIFSSLMNFFKLMKMKKNIDKDFEYEFTHGIIYEYTFHEEKFGLIIKVGNRTSKVEEFYKNLKKIVNYPDIIVFVFSTGDAYKCKKENFKNPKEEELFFYGLKKHKIKVIDKIK